MHGRRARAFVALRVCCVTAALAALVANGAGCLDVADVAENTGGATAGGAGGSGGSDAAATGGSGGGTGGATGGSGGMGGGGGTSATTLGSPCQSDPDCGPGLFCASPEAFGGEDTPSICVRACCRSEDCGDASSVCFPSPGGGNVCLPGTAVGRPAVAGAAPGGALCTMSVECRSGVCANGTCFDTCCTDATCPGSAACTKLSHPGSSRSVMACGDAPGSLGYLAPCSSDSQCVSGVCLAAGVCGKPCCTSKDCAGAVNLVCRYSSGLRMCISGGASLGSHEVGAACATSNECKTGLCLTAPGGAPYCSDACCSDADCPAGLACRAVTASGTTQLLCVAQ